ncbi:MAG TPA: glycosyltransferase family 2 protein [Phycisphaerales bacterium]|nr:glycosyltransferase family 2 protein [Phycisphaerales bacterium]
MVSIIVLTCNNLESATKLFIDSLFQCTCEDQFELIIVDNGSKDGTVDYLKELSSRHSNIKLIFNDENNGYSKGNNQGLRIARGQYLCLVNNDILFTANWLDKLVSILQCHPEIGLISPVVNEPGDAVTSENYLDKMPLSVQTRDGCFQYSLSASFCCVCMHRKVFEKIGYLDEAFTPAYYEDADYCLRALYQGYKNAILLNSFVFHNHCQTSGTLADRAEIRRRNRLYYYDKHIIAEYIGKLRDENKLLRKKLFSYRIKKIFIEFICFFVHPKKRKKKCRKRLNHKLHLTSNDGCNYASENIDYF